MPRPDEQRDTLLIITQVYPPDPASVGQHFADAAAELARRGWRVRVVTSARGYDDPSKTYPAREVREGVEVVRLPFASFGKKSIPVRLLGGMSFVGQAVLRGLFTPRLRALLVSTSPPMCSAGALVISYLRGAPVKYWVMDLNPDQVLALGRMKPGSPLVRAANFFNRRILGAADVVALDRFMAERLEAKRPVRDKLHVMPPWPHEDVLDTVPHESNDFRRKHNPDNRFVIMYSGNHGPSSPVTTALQAAMKLRDDPRVLFMFIGGGVGKKEVDDLVAREKPRNVVSLPYQPFDTLRWSLSAADVHLVTVGDAIVGIVHPCKVYGAMAVGRPIFLIGPRPSHVSDILDEHRVGWQVQHGDVDGAVRSVKEMLEMPPEELRRMGAVAQRLVAERFSKRELCGRFCDVVERGVRRDAPATRAAAAVEV